MSRCAILIFSITLISGCHKGDDPRPGHCYLISESLSAPNLTATQTFTYSENRIIKCVATTPSGKNTIDFVYDSRGNLTEKRSDVSGIIYSYNSSEIYTYNSSDELIKTEEFMGTDLQRIVEFTHSNGRLSKIQYYERSLELPYTFTKGAYAVYEYSSSTSKDPSIINHFSIDNTIFSTRVLEYDDKKTPYHATPGFKASRAFIIEGRYNNITRETLTYPSVSNTARIKTSTYSYNEDGYPIKATLVDDAGSVFVTEYAYDCR
jgi:hypothetical protein